MAADESDADALGRALAPGADGDDLEQQQQTQQAPHDQPDMNDRLEKPDDRPDVDPRARRQLMIARGLALVMVAGLCVVWIAQAEVSKGLQGGTYNHVRPEKDLI